MIGLLLHVNEVLRQSLHYGLDPFFFQRQSCCLYLHFLHLLKYCSWGIVEPQEHYEGGV